MILESFDGMIDAQLVIYDREVSRFLNVCLKLNQKVLVPKLIEQVTRVRNERTKRLQPFRDANKESNFTVQYYDHMDMFREQQNLKIISEWTLDQSYEAITQLGMYPKEFVNSKNSIQSHIKLLKLLEG